MATDLAIPARWVLAIRLAYLAILFLATLVPLGLDATPGAVISRLVRAFHPRYSMTDAVDAARNLVLFSGWGAIWVLTEPARRARGAVMRATLTAGLLGTLIETIQLFSRFRTSSILDVMTNATGGLLGALGLLVVVAMARAMRGRRSFVGIPTVLFGGSYLVAAWLEAFLPLLRQERLVGAVGSPGARLAVALATFREAPQLGFAPGDLLLFLPVGLLAVPALVELGLSYRRAGILVSAWVPLLLAIAELAHGAVGFPVELGPVLAHSIAVVGGAWLAARGLPGLTRQYRGRVRPMVLLLGYMLVLVFWVWRPFSPETVAGLAGKLTLPRFIPMAAFRERTDLFTAIDVLESVLLFAPVGALLAVWPLRLRGALAHLLPGLYLAALLETGQILVAGRTFDITDLIIDAAALGLGWAVTRRAGFRPYGQLFPPPPPAPPPGRRGGRERR